jgi:hypothetical protein
MCMKRSGEIVCCTETEVSLPVMLRRYVALSTFNDKWGNSQAEWSGD